MRIGMGLRLMALGRTVSRYIVEVFGIFQLHEVGDIKERVALQADVNKSGLHSGKNAGDASFVDGTTQGVFFLALEEDFREQIVFDHAHFGFVGVEDTNNSLVMRTPVPGPSVGLGITGWKAGKDWEDQASRW